MTGWKRSAVSVACGVVLTALSAAAAPALTLMVNGTTPSRYFQWLADGYARHMPTPPGIVDLFIGMRPGPACPRSIAGRPESRVGACAIPPALNPDGRPGVRLMPLLFRPDNIEDLRGTFAHELGHLELDLLTVNGGILTDSDRARFAMIWRRPQLGWWQPMRASCAGEVTIGGAFPEDTGADCGEPSDAGEWAAEAYRLCATGGWRSELLVANLGYLPDRGMSPRPEQDSDLRRTRAPILASCGLFRAAAKRAG